MAERNIEAFLPLYQTTRQWKKRIPVDLELPLFPGYLFARIEARSRGLVLRTPGVCSLVGNGRQAIPVPESEIEALRNGLHLRKAEPHPWLSIGERVRIRTGALAGMEGVLVRKKNALRVVLSVDMIMQSVSVEVELADIESVREAGKPETVVM